jgi:hypothetical protein
VTGEGGQGFKEWCLVELMGHRRMAGLVSEATIGGAALTRIDVYLPDGAAPILTQFYGPSAIYALTPMGERECRQFAARNVPQPVTRYEIEPPRPTCSDCGRALNGVEVELGTGLCSRCRGDAEEDDERTADDVEPADVPF